MQFSNEIPRTGLVGMLRQRAALTRRVLTGSFEPFINASSAPI